MIAPIAQLSYLGPPVRSCPCRRCGRVLHDPGSIAVQAGPVCRRFLPHPAKEISMSVPHASPATRPAEPVTYFGWQALAKQPAVDALALGLTRYRELHGRAAAVVLCHPETAAELGVTGNDVAVLERPNVPRGTFYLGAA